MYNPEIPNSRITAPYDRGAPELEDICMRILTTSMGLVAMNWQVPAMPPAAANHGKDNVSVPKYSLNISPTKSLTKSSKATVGDARGCSKDKRKTAESQGMRDYGQKYYLVLAELMRR